MKRKESVLESGFEWLNPCSNGKPMRQKHLIFQYLPLFTEPTWISMEVYILFNVCFSHTGTTYLSLQSSLKALLYIPSPVAHKFKNRLGVLINYQSSCRSRVICIGFVLLKKILNELVLSLYLFIPVF